MYRKIWFAMVEGVKIGAVSYLLVLAMQLQPTPVTPSNIISMLIMSAFIGLISLIFDTDYFSLLVSGFIHFTSVLAVVILGMLYNGWDVFAVPFWLNFIGIYILIWIVVLINNAIRTRKINNRLSELRKGNEEV